MGVLSTLLDGDEPLSLPHRLRWNGSRMAKPTIRPARIPAVDCEIIFINRIPFKIRQPEDENVQTILVRRGVAALQLLLELLDLLRLQRVRLLAFLEVFC